MNDKLLKELCTGKVVSLSVPIKLKRVEYDEAGKKSGEFEEVVQAKEEKYIAPSEEAIKFLLDNATQAPVIVHDIPRPDHEH